MIRTVPDDGKEDKLESERTNGTPSETDVEGVLTCLGSAFSVFLEKEAQKQPSSTKRITRLFAGWFSGFNPLSSDPGHQAFLDEVERIIAQLVSNIEKIKVKWPDVSISAAARAAEILLPPKSGRERTPADWTLTVAEYQLIHLIPFLAADTLKDIRATLLRRTPKRMMFPKQRELIAVIDTLLKQ